MEESKNPDNKLPYKIPETECANQINWEEIMQSKEPLRSKNWRYLFITTGSPGSGKTCSIEFLKKYVKNLVQQRDIKSWSTVSHDKYVEKDGRYDDILEKYDNQSYTDTPKSKRQSKREKRNELEKMYLTIRNGEGEREDSDRYIKNIWESDEIISEDNITSQDVENFGTRVLVYKDLVNSVIEKKNIIYETTGEKWNTVINTFNQIVKHHCNKDSPKYIIILVYNYLDIINNIQNLQKRWQESIESYRKSKLLQEEKEASQVIKKFESEKPRNWVGKERELKLKRMILNIRNNIKYIAEQCYDIKTRQGICKGVGPDILFVFNRSEIFKVTPIKIPLSLRGTLIIERSKRIKSKSSLSKKAGEEVLKFLNADIENLDYLTNQIEEVHSETPKESSEKISTTTTGVGGNKISKKYKTKQRKKTKKTKKKTKKNKIKKKKNKIKGKKK